MTFSRDLIPLATRAIFAKVSCSRPLYNTALSARRILGSICESRSRIDVAPKSGDVQDHSAPIDDVAKNATTEWDVLANTPIISQITWASRTAYSIAFGHSNSFQGSDKLSHAISKFSPSHALLNSCLRSLNDRNSCIGIFNFR